MHKEKAQEIIVEILKNSITKRKPFQIEECLSEITPGINISVWAAISSVIEKYNMKASLPYQTFDPLFSEFKKNAKRDFQKAVDIFLSSISSAYKRPVQPAHISRIPVTKLPPKKITRKVDLKYSEDLMDFWDNMTTFFPLIAKKNYFLELDKGLISPKGKRSWFLKLTDDETQEKRKKDIAYLYFHFGIPLKDCKNDYENHSDLVRLNEYILRLIEIFKRYLENLTKFLLNDRKVPNAKTWFVDVFGESSERYLPNWSQYHRKSYNMPNFNKSFKTFVKLLKKGSTPKELGYSSKNYHNLRYDIIPQGLIVLLFLVHHILYGRIDKEKAILRQKEKQIKEILQDATDIEAFKLLSKLHNSSIEKLLS